MSFGRETKGYVYQGEVCAPQPRRSAVRPQESEKSSIENDLRTPQSLLLPSTTLKKRLCSSGHTESCQKCESTERVTPDSVKGSV